MKGLKKIALVSSFLILMACFVGCGKDKGKKTLTIGYLPITHALPVLEVSKLVEDKDDYTIELKKFSSWSDLTDALNAGRIDGASMLMELAMNAVSQGIELKAVALGHRDGNVIVAANDVKRPIDLKGKKFAIPHNLSSHNILMQEMLEKGGLTTKDITVIQLAPSEMPSSLASGAISGYCVAEPFGAQAVEQNIGHVLYESEELWEDSLCCALVLSNQFIKKNKGIVDSFLAKYHKGANHLQLQTAKDTASKYLGQGEKVLEMSLGWITFDELNITKESYEDIREKMMKYDVMATPPSYETFVYNQEE